MKTNLLFAVILFLFISKNSIGITSDIPIPKCTNQSITLTSDHIVNDVVWWIFSSVTGWSQLPLTTPHWSLTVNPTTATTYKCVYGGGAYAPETFTVTIITSLGIPGMPATPTGLNQVCQGQSSVIYSIPLLQYATSYHWTLPSGATGTSLTNSITVNYSTSALSGNITVFGRCDCINQAGPTKTVAITVNPIPANAGVISGTAAFCQGLNSETYSVPIINNATSYVWTLPSGANGTSTSNSITVDYGMSSASGTITVKGNNSCGFGTISTLPITINSIPATPLISLNINTLQSNSVVGNQWFDQNGLISGSIGQNYTPLIDGDYYSIVTINGCSSNPSNIIHVTITEIEQNTLGNNSIKLYPNPVTNELIIKNTGGFSIIGFEIINTIGQTIYKGNLEEKTIIPTINFAGGIYYIKIENGETFEFKKIIKE